jgi:hypothetical protein
MLAEAVVVQSVIATRLGDGSREVQIVMGGRDLYLLPKSTLALGPTQPTIQGVPGFLMGEGLCGHEDTNLCGG